MNSNAKALAESYKRKIINELNTHGIPVHDISMRFWKNNDGTWTMRVSTWVFGVPYNAQYTPKVDGLYPLEYRQTVDEHIYEIKRRLGLWE